MTRAAIYSRYSSDLQSPTSIADQVRLCEAYVARQDWSVTARYEDRALSGFGVEHRPGYQALLRAALSSPRPFDVIVVEDMSRLTRDSAELIRLGQRLRLRGIELVGVSDGIATGRPGGKLTLAFKGLVNEIYLDDLGDRTRRGLAGQVTRGLSAGGRCFGYRAVPTGAGAGPDRRQRPAEIEINPAEATWSRRRSFAPTRRGVA